jgi:hypothetical protein
MNFLDVGSLWREWDLHVHAPTSVTRSIRSRKSSETYSIYNR